jgi:signal transduction histidine kinase
MELFKNIRFINKGIAVIIATLFIVTIVTTIYLAKTLLDARRLISNGTTTVSAVFLLQDLELNLKTAESSQRGYVLTGDSKHLQGYYAAIVIIPKEQKALANHSYGINKEERDNLNNLITDRLLLLKHVIEVRKHQGLEPAAAIITENKGLDTTTKIDIVAKRITREKFAPFSATYQQTQKSLEHALIVAGIMICFIFIITFVMASYFQKALTKERATEGVKNEFLSLASHQLRTPASNVKQYLGLLLEGYLGKLKPEQKDAIEVANRNNEIGINIINDLLGVAKLDLDKIRLKKKKLNIYLLVKEVVEDYRPQLRDRKQTIKFERAVKKVEADADAYYLKSVFENLLDNASKYSPKKTRILIRVEQNAKRIVISIKDEGIGIRKNEKSKLFKKFSRIPSESTSNVEGSGLGLYWVKQIVELHGGRISVKSSHGRGSTFIVEFPRINEDSKV